jgi:hypothetical protein
MKHLDALTARAQQAAKAVALQFDTVEVRRERVLAYGRALLAIRKEIKSTQKFREHLEAHGELLVHDRTFRTDAMWLAEVWRDEGHILHQCNSANPTYIRKWWRDRNRQAAKTKTNGTKKTQTADASGSESQTLSFEQMLRKVRKRLELPYKLTTAEARAFAEFKTWFLIRTQPKPVDPEKRSKLVKILGKLGSDGDGEVLNAARFAEERRRELNCTWGELIRS